MCFSMPNQSLVGRVVWFSAFRNRNLNLCVCSFSRTATCLQLVRTTPRVGCSTFVQTRKYQCTRTTTSSAESRRPRSARAAVCSSAATTTSTATFGTCWNKTALASSRDTTTEYVSQAVLALSSPWFHWLFCCYISPIFIFLNWPVEHDWLTAKMSQSIYVGQFGISFFFKRNFQNFQKYFFNRPVQNDWLFEYVGSQYELARTSF